MQQFLQRFESLHLHDAVGKQSSNFAFFYPKIITELNTVLGFPNPL